MIMNISPNGIYIILQLLTIRVMINLNGLFIIKIDTKPFSKIVTTHAEVSQEIL